jgi:hypothetical protein
LLRAARLKKVVKAAMRLFLYRKDAIKPPIATNSEANQGSHDDLSFSVMSVSSIFIITDKVYSKVTE